MRRRYQSKAKKNNYLARVNRARLRLNVLENKITPTTLYPDLLAIDKPQPITSYTFPSGFDQFDPPVSNDAPNAGSPVLSEWTRTGGVGHTIAVTGDGFSTFQGSEFGKDTEFFTYVQTVSGNKSDGMLEAASIARLDGPRAAVTLSDIRPSHSMYLLWASNQEGVSRPVPLNRAETWWLGSDRAAAGESVTVFGRNLTEEPESNSNAWVYLEEQGIPTKVPPGQWIHIADANPYRAEFTLPSKLDNGTYNVFIHNSHGAEWGFSRALTLEIDDPLPSGGTVFDVTDAKYGATGNGIDDDSTFIAKAIAAADAVPGSTVYFPAGTYAIGSPLYLLSRTHITFEGALDKNNDIAATIKPLANSSLTSLFLNNSGDLYEAKNLQFKNLKLTGDGLVRDVNGSGPIVAQIRYSSDHRSSTSTTTASPTPPTSPRSASALESRCHHNNCVGWVEALRNPPDLLC